MNFPLQPLRTALLAILFGGATLGHAQAATYDLPADLTRAPFNCTYSAGVYACPSISLGHHTTFNLTAAVSISVNGDFSADHHFLTLNNGNKLTLNVTGDLEIAHQSNVQMDLNKVERTVRIAHQTNIVGNVTVGNKLTIDHHTVIDGNVTVTGDMYVEHHSDITGTCTVGGYTAYKGCAKPAPAPSLHHFHIEHKGTGLTCQPSAITVSACSGPSNGNTCPTSTAGASGKLEARDFSTAALIASYNITIPANQSSVTIMVPYANTKTVSLGTTTAGSTCWNGGAADCKHVYQESGFEIGVPNHVSATTPTASIAAVRKSPDDTCVAAFTGVKPVTFSCSYLDPKNSAPASGGMPGTRPVKLTSGTESIELTCGGAGQSLEVTFDQAGKGQFGLNYQDVGLIELNASFAVQGMTGSTSFISYPKKFQVTWPNPSATLVAGEPFKVKVTALNNSDEPTWNYGREETPESALLSFVRCQPADGRNGASSGTLQAFAQGSAESNNSQWGEVGTLDVKAANADYLGVAANIEGSSDLDPDTAAGKCTGLFGRFRPKYFKTSLHDASRAWTYSGEPFGVVVSGFNANDLATYNYNKVDGFSRDVTFTAQGVAPDPVTSNPGPGALQPAKIETKDLLDLAPPGGAVVAHPAYAFAAASLPVKPTRIALCATDSDGVNSNNNCGAILQVRTGRLRMSNAFGGVDRDLTINARIEYWSGSSWLTNKDDSTTVLPLTALALTPAPSVQEVKALGTNPAYPNELRFALGSGTFKLNKPKRDKDHNGVGSVLISANLGETTMDASCLDEHPPTAAGKLSWLRSRNGTCDPSGAMNPAVIWAQDPTARASFGVTTRENRATIHVREAFN